MHSEHKDSKDVRKTRRMIALLLQRQWACLFLTYLHTRRLADTRVWLISLLLFPDFLHPCSLHKCSCHSGFLKSEPKSQGSLPESRLRPQFHLQCVDDWELPPLFGTLQLAVFDTLGWGGVGWRGALCLAVVRLCEKDKRKCLSVCFL